MRLVVGHGAPGVLGVADALHEQRQLGQRPQPGQVIPAQGVSEDLHPPQDGALRVFLRRVLQAGAKDRVAEVVVQAVTAQLRKV